MKHTPNPKALALLAIFAVWTIALPLTAITTTSEIALNPVEVATPLDKLSPGVKDLLGEGLTSVNVIVQTNTHEYQELIQYIESLGGTVNVQYQSINALAITIPAFALLDLASHSLV
jgi:hypothetical protein